MEIASTWYGTFLRERGRLVKERPFPPDSSALVERLRRRREGYLAPEEEELLAENAVGELTSRDRRFQAKGVRPSADRGPAAEPPAPTGPNLRDLLLAEGEAALHRAWDPSVHTDEAVRAMKDLDHIRNLLGERIASWASRDRPSPGDPEGEDADRAIRSIIEPGRGESADELEGDPALLEIRRELAREYRRLSDLRRSLDRAVEEATERRTPNLTNLLGPLLAARLVSQAGGLDRLARLPSSTVQVLGAEKAFFDHLRRGSRPPRHGLLFLHPSIQGASKRERGRIARALAGKVSIAARLDRAGKPVDPSLEAAFRRRTEEILGAAQRPRGTRGSREPLDRAAEHR